MLPKLLPAVLAVFVAVLPTAAAGQGYSQSMPLGDADYVGAEYGDADYCGPAQATGGWSPWLNLRTSLTHGRSVGLGDPLRGTSWLNRPFEFAIETGALVMATDPGGGSSKANDIITAAQLGWDFDHYWGSQVRIAWSTPNYNNQVAPTSDASNDLVIYDASLLYYPWGDSRVRPYYRLGLGLTDIDYIDGSGNPMSEALVTIPFGVGLKYQKHRWLALRMEAVDNLAFGQGGTNTLNNLTFMFGAEWRFGGRPTPGWRREGTRGI